MAAKPSFRRSLFAALAALTVVLAFGASSALAATGSVYFDGNANGGAGHDFFGGTTPTGIANVGLGYSVMPNLTSGQQNIGDRHRRA